jgi:hypothetical protein
MEQKNKLAARRSSAALSATELNCLSGLRKPMQPEAGLRKPIGKGPMTRAMRLRFLRHLCIEKLGTIFTLTPRGRTALLIGHL